MIAYRLLEWRQPPQLVDVPVPEPGPGQVLIRVGGAGVCHSDIHIMEYPGGVLSWQVPFTLGHENAGWVEAWGPGVTGLERSEPVAVYGAWGCGRCPRCREGRETLCERAKQLGANGGGLGLDGGMAEYMLVPSARWLVPLGDLDPRDAAPLSDAALTPYHAIRLAGDRLRPGATAVVIGVGGLGHMAVQLLRATTPVRIVAVDVDEPKLALAREVGADVTVAAADAPEERIRALTGGLGAEAVFDLVGSDATLALAAAVARVGGAIQVVGLHGGTLPVAFGRVPFDCPVTVPYWGTLTELVEVLELARAGRIHAHTERFPLERVDEAYARLRAGTLAGRAVITPNG